MDIWPSKVLIVITDNVSNVVKAFPRHFNDCETIVDDDENNDDDRVDVATHDVHRNSSQNVSCLSNTQWGSHVRNRLLLIPALICVCRAF